ncbi:MAG: hypothetical protein COA78_32635 [Blastopirellula sp.]|nr:MAG: hypothetical protein COA78_32635 [Blastopirellula sp.]
MIQFDVPSSASITCTLLSWAYRIVDMVNTKLRGSQHLAMKEFLEKAKRVMKQTGLSIIKPSYYSNSN